MCICVCMCGLFVCVCVVCVCVKYTYICMYRQAFALACMHRVKIESNFANVCIAIMVLEGVGRQLDPTLDILQAAAPVVLRNLVRANFAAPPAAP